MSRIYTSLNVNQGLSSKKDNGIHACMYVYMRDNAQKERY